METQAHMKASVEDKSFTLRSGDKMPAVGFGCWKVPKD